MKLKTPFQLSRRDLLRTAGAGAVTMWIPKPVKGYSGAEMLAAPVDTAGRVSVGISKWELDTPALCVDLDKMEQNFATLQKVMVANKIASRPHAKTHKCPAIARLQIASGSIGVCTTKVSEAEAMFAGGVEKIMMTTANLTPVKIRRAMALRKRCSGFIQAVDNVQNARDLSAAAKEAGVVADVVVDVDPGLHRTGVPVEAAVALAKLVATLPGLKLRGMLSYDGDGQHVRTFKARRARALEGMEAPAAAFASMKSAGLNVEIFSGGGSGTYNIQHETPGFTDVQAGSYLFMSGDYTPIGGQADDKRYTDFTPSLTVVTTITNAYTEGRATTDAGTKALVGGNLIEIVGATGMTYKTFGDEFGWITYQNPSRTYKVGDKLEVITPHCDPTVNLYDQIYGTRKDRVEVVWPITARGKSQ
jgi:D-serine deaminase-like pyridoxal phosphate-dependent protein